MTIRVYAVQRQTGTSKHWHTMTKGRFYSGTPAVFFSEEKAKEVAGSLRERAKSGERFRVHSFLA